MYLHFGVHRCRCYPIADKSLTSCFREALLVSTLIALEQAVRLTILMHQNFFHYEKKYNTYKNTLFYYHREII